MVREVARNAGADLGIIGTVLASDAVENKVLGAEKVLRTADSPNSRPDNQDTRRAAS
ncbi:hypothetical protein [Streptomyces sp. NPDC000878]